METEQHPETFGPAVALSNERSSHVRAASVNAPHVTVLRTNLRGFPKTFEMLDPGPILPMLDEYADLVSNVARKNGGEVCGVESLSMTIGFGPREPTTNASAGAAVRTAKLLLDGFEQLSNRWRDRVERQIALSIGIHRSEVIAASLGSGSNRNPTVVGDTVDIATRLAERARAGEAILSAAIREALRDELPGIEIKPLGGMSFAARTRHIRIYCIPRADRLDLGEARRERARH